MKKSVLFLGFTMLFCACQETQQKGQTQTKKQETPEDQNFQERREQMQQQNNSQPKGGCCGAANDEVSVPKGLAESTEVKVEKVLPEKAE